MKQRIFRNMQLAVSIGSGFATYQYFFMTDGAFDFYGPIVVSAFTFVVSSIGTVLKEIIMRKKETA
ncbi:hypothetical protein AB9R81_00530 [Vibrio cyclitrophicus]|uniref:hypothetical protein n=1 Tax=Vibrio TaxID=662 RepID=UPI00029B0D53|nr:MULTISPECIES: hypothetical protein [Vibrio]MBY7660220.1 hypothetical protein [Vibrio atlanticus]MBE8555022.1 hypothetical protein [Vibrio sp. OPT24]MDW1507503.1 hypothetical protein [Vibrio sp. Vb5031]OED69976.1 hypothetical protein OAU_08025 [Vibrio cyclitrophicus ZF99]OEE29939.1 hypothetical protein OAM_00700 [Vibrio cyclitrophicus ZF14]